MTYIQVIEIILSVCTVLFAGYSLYKSRKDSVPAKRKSDAELHILEDIDGQMYAMLVTESPEDIRAMSRQAYVTLKVKHTKAQKNQTL